MPNTFAWLVLGDLLVLSFSLLAVLEGVGDRHWSVDRAGETVMGRKGEFWEDWRGFALCPYHAISPLQISSSGGSQSIVVDVWGDRLVPGARTWFATMLKRISVGD